MERPEIFSQLFCATFPLKAYIRDMKRSWRFTILIIFIIGVFGQEDASQKRHTNNWAVLVDTSRFWFNYRHVANTLGIYRTVKRLGIPDSQVHLRSILQQSENFMN